MEGGNSENAASFYVICQNSNRIFFRPKVSLSVEGTVLTLREPPIVLMEILPQSFLTRIKFPAQSLNLERVDRFELEGTNTLKMEGRCIAPVPGYMYTGPRVQRVYPPANFSLSFDSPTQVNEIVSAPVFRMPSESFHVEVLRPGGPVDLTRYPRIHVSDL